MLTEKVSKEEFIEEFVSKGFDKRIVEDLATRQYHSQLTIQDLEVLELKIKNEIEITRNQLDKRIDKLETEIKLTNKDIKEIYNKLSFSGQLSTVLVGIGSAGLITFILKIFEYMSNK